jgi:hypothetical protein
MDRNEILECLRGVPLSAEDEAMRAPMLAFAAECPDAALESIEALLGRYDRGLEAIRAAAETDAAKAEKQLREAHEQQTDRGETDPDPDEAYL